MVAITALALLAAGAPALALNQNVISDINIISKYWGQISPYSDNDENQFGIQDVGMPEGCQIEQVHSFQRHSNRFPTSYFDDAINDENFASKVQNFTTANTKSKFTGPLAFLNSYNYIMGESYLTGLGASSEFNAGVAFWNRYGRTLYNAPLGQLAYNASYSNGTARPRPLLRTTSQSRMQNSQISWALGFFGPSFREVADPTFANYTEEFDVLIIPEGGTENNTLASYDACFNDYDYYVGYVGDLDIYQYLPKYLSNATARLQSYVPQGFNLTFNDTFAMQSICAYEQVGTTIRVSSCTYLRVLGLHRHV